MQKDLKIGLVLGLAFVSIAGLWLATRPSLTPQGQLLDEGGIEKNATDEARGTKDEGQSDYRPPSVVRRSSSVPPVMPIRRAVTDESIERNSLVTPAVRVQPETIQPQRFHIVRKDETLSQISYEYYGSAGKWRKIFEANRSTVKNANFVKAGTKLIIPDE